MLSDRFVQARNTLKSKYQKSLSKVIAFESAQDFLKQRHIRIEPLQQKHADKCISLTSSSLIVGNTLSELLNLTIDKEDIVSDINIISKARIEHAISTGLSFVVIDNYSDQVIGLNVWFDIADMPVDLDQYNQEFEFKSKEVKFRSQLVSQATLNDKWWQSMKQKYAYDTVSKDNCNYNNNININNMFGNVMNYHWACTDPTYKRTSFFQFTTFIGLTVALDVGYNYLLFDATTHWVTLHYHQRFIDISNLETNSDCHGLVKRSILWNYSTNDNFLKYMTSIGKDFNKMIQNGENVMCQISQVVFDFSRINPKFETKDFWQWTQIEFPKYRKQVKAKRSLKSKL